MEYTKILVVGSGKLANAILNANWSSQPYEVIKWDSRDNDLQEPAILVHAGSGRQLKECLEYCARTKSVFIELSTGLETTDMNPDFPLIICPNTSMLVLKTLNMLLNAGKHFENYDISITESHQSSKITEAGTAYAFAKSLKFPTEKIVSIRDPEVQRTVTGIPGEYLNKHAYHKIVIQDGNDQLTIETKVLGHESYARGVKKIIETILQCRLENRKYTINELIDLHML